MGRVQESLAGWMENQNLIQTLDQLDAGESRTIKGLNGGQHFISRATAIGFTPGAAVEAVQNYRRLPLIVFLRDSLIAIDRSEAKRIILDES
jgi:ferrous iron transport protein A